MIQKEKFAAYQNRPKSSLHVIRSIALPKLFRKKSLFCSANSSENSTPNNSLSKFKYSSKVITKFIPPNSPHSSSNTDDDSVLTIKLEKIKKIYQEKSFGKFYGFTAFTFKNKEICNSDELDMCINKEANVSENKKANNSPLQVHLFAIHHGTNGQDVSVLLKKRLQYYLFKNTNYISNPLQGISDAYQKLEFEVYQTIPKSYECGSSSILALIIKNQMYIANIGNSKCLISCQDKTPFYILTHSNNLSARKIPNYNHNKDKQLSLTLKQCVNLETPLIKPENPFLKQINTLNNVSNLDKKQFLFAVPEITEMSITDNIYFFIFINDSIAKAVSSKKIMITIYKTVLESLHKDYSFKDMCSSLINQICIEVIKTECTTSISVVFLPLMSFVSLYDKSNENEIEEMIKQIENENDEQVYNKCVIHEPNTNGLFNASSMNNSSMFDKKLKENTIVAGNDNLANLRTIETYNITNNKGKCVSQNNTLHSQHSTMSNNRTHKKESDKHKKKKMLCGCFA